MSDVWTTDEDDPRTYGNPEGEKATYAEYLTNYRITLRLKCDGLTPEQLATRSVPPSTMSLLGLVRHLAAVEHYWFRVVAQGSPVPRPYRHDGDRDADFNEAFGTQECLDEAFARWDAVTAEAAAWLDALPESELATQLPVPGVDDVVSVRDLVVHMIEEYARHVGHADLLRECIDGRTGQ
ncbi:hypothetical protein ASD11_16375 [Aeromicrobium sp. Root495]|uniref:DinB family protein n=1 Tax=Aeromicrobium sp. Root495 TaxID=1736550 RepID=UPI00070198D4|nr:DinB family protein [Aeromicrobium sp. Root495]KQY56207.1 hypothetical protein ASD11_16375 [Aeromicrobium sp. Root495]